MVEEKCAIILVVILYLSTIQAFDLECHFQSMTFNDIYVIECTNDVHVDGDTIPQSFFTRNAAIFKTKSIKSGVTRLHVSGAFNELRFEGPPDWFSVLSIFSGNLELFDLSKYKNNTQLKIVRLGNSNKQVTVKLNSTKHLDDLRLVHIKEVKFECTSLKASKLKRLEVYDTHFIGFSFDCLPQEIQELRLSNITFNSFDGMASLKKLTNLEILNLGSTGLKSFNLANLPAPVTQLDLSGNNLEPLKTLPLKGLLNLEMLDLGRTGLESFNAKNIPASVSILYLDSNSLNSFNVQDLPASVTFLALSYNNLRSFDVESLPSNIEYLYLTNCHLTIDMSLFRPYTQLKNLYLIGNKDVNGNSLGFYENPNTNTISNRAAAPSTTVDPNTPDDVGSKTSDDDSDDDDTKTGDDNNDVGSKTGDNDDVDNKSSDDDNDVGSKTGDTATNDKVDDDDDNTKVGASGNDCARNHVFMPLIVVMCVRIIVTFL